MPSNHDPPVSARPPKHCGKDRAPAVGRDGTQPGHVPVATRPAAAGAFAQARCRVRDYCSRGPSPARAAARSPGQRAAPPDCPKTWRHMPRISRWARSDRDKNTLAPDAKPARTPLGESSTTAHSAGSTPSSSMARKKMSGAGLAVFNIPAAGHVIKVAKKPHALQRGLGQIPKGRTSLRRRAHPPRAGPQGTR